MDGDGGGVDNGQDNGGGNGESKMRSKQDTRDGLQALVIDVHAHRHIKRL